MTKKKVATSKKAKPNPELVAITARRDEVMKTAQQLAIVHNLLSQGLYQGAGASDLVQALQFIQSIHQPVLAEYEALEAKVAELTPVSTVDTLKEEPSNV